MLYDDRGIEYRAYIRQNFTDVTNHDGGGFREVLPTTQVCKLADGTPLNYVDEKTFRNPISGELLRRR